MTKNFNLLEQEFLQESNKQLLEMFANDAITLAASVQSLSQAAQHLCLTPNAKRARPLLTFCLGHALKADPEIMLDIGLAAELVHSASLLHDDVIDEASTRRGMPSVNAKFSVATSVLAGNFVLTLAFLRLKKYSMEVTGDAIAVVREMTKAVMSEIDIRGNLSISTDVWREIAIGKTGRLFGWCGQAIARVMEREEERVSFEKLGEHIGIAFQMLDDLKDLLDNSKLKDQCSDIRNKEPSYPILLAIEQCATTKAAFEDAWQKKVFEVEPLRDLVLKSDAVEISCSNIKANIEAAATILGNHQHSAGGQRLIDWLGELHQTAERLRSQ